VFVSVRSRNGRTHQLVERDLAVAEGGVLALAGAGGLEGGDDLQPDVLAVYHLELEHVAECVDAGPALAQRQQLQRAQDARQPLQEALPPAAAVH